MVTHNIVDTILLDNIDNPASLFIFPTNVAASRWADRLLRLRGSLRPRNNSADNGIMGNSIPMEKFIAWDTFKQDSIRSRIKNRKNIPPVLRRMFVSALIRENSELWARGKPPVFTSLIRTEWAQQADFLSGWLVKILPQLGARYSQAAGYCAQTGENAIMREQAADHPGDERDLFTLADRYAQFLDSHNLFEPAWERPPFEDMGKKCFIFFPESLYDFNEYKTLLEASNHVTIINSGDLVPAENNETTPFDCFFYANSRSEITEAALYIIALHHNQGVPWDSISVNIPDEGIYIPYLSREFENRNIPYIVQIGKPLSGYPAGQFFTALAGCASADFSFAAVKELLLNQHLPWKEGDTIRELINFGIRNNCISSWVEEEADSQTAVNVWEAAFAHPLGGIAAHTRHFFEDLRRRVIALCRAGSFSDIRKQYFAFRQRFFDMQNCLDETDLILSRCISELSHLADIEREFPDVRVPHHYSFFTGYLGGINYLAQQSVSGVAILPYRTAAPAPFDCHIVLGASQSGLSAVFSPLAFLPKSRRQQLGITDNDASLTFINLHRLNSRLPAAFFCSEQTFSGYAIPHHALSAHAPDAVLKPRQRYGDDPQYRMKFAADLYRAESNVYARLYSPSREQIAPLPELHTNQQQGFENWRSRREHAIDGGGITVGHPLLNKIREQFCYNNEFNGKISVSSSSLASYFQCPLRWVFSRLFKLENVEIDTGLMAANITGEVYHAVLNLFLDELKKSDEAIVMPLNSGTDKKPVYTLPRPYTDLLERTIETVFESFPRLPHNEHQSMSVLTAHLLRAEKSLFFSRLENLLAVFTASFSGFKVIACEENYTLDNDIYFLNGRIDCILEDARNGSSRNNPMIIVDFKTKYKPEEDMFDFQLPLYLRLAEEKYRKKVSAGLFFSIIDSKHYDGIMRENSSFNETMDEFDQKARQFAQEASNGTFSFYPSHPEQCLKCDYNKVCRTLYKVQQGRSNETRKATINP